MYYGIATHKTFIQKPYQEGHIPALYAHAEHSLKKKDSEVTHPLPYIDDQVWKAAITAKK